MPQADEFVRRVSEALEELREVRDRATKAERTLEILLFDWNRQVAEEMRRFRDERSIPAPAQEGEQQP